MKGVSDCFSEDTEYFVTLRVSLENSYQPGVEQVNFECYESSIIEHELRAWWPEHRDQKSQTPATPELLAVHENVQNG